MSRPLYQASETRNKDRPHLAKHWTPPHSNLSVHAQKPSRQGGRVGVGRDDAAFVLGQETPPLRSPRPLEGLLAADRGCPCLEKDP